MSHTFHIPVLGLAYSVDTPVKVAKFGISSVISIVDDILLERMRKFYSEKYDLQYLNIPGKEADARSKRITSYLNLINDIVRIEFENLKKEPFEPLSDISRYFDLLPATSNLKEKYNLMLKEADLAEKARKERELRQEMKPGAIDVNIMSKVDKLNKSSIDIPLEENSDALAALRGFANSDLTSSVILSAGMNPRLYSYLENFREFYPDRESKKKVILKVSDFRSALIQAKFLAKKGIWVSEFRVESGLNCGGHAFATEGFLLGPILEEFRQKREEMKKELATIYAAGLAGKGFIASDIPSQKITAQGGIGTAEENEFLMSYYGLDGTGWGSPFLLVPEVTNVDNSTLANLINAGENDFYISGSSPLGVPFNNFRHSSAEKLRLERIAKQRPGSPCTKKYLVSNTEFTDNPICTASREYQKHKIEQLKSYNYSESDYQKEFKRITEKLCLCEGLSTSAYYKTGTLQPKENKAVVICPGPNLAYFDRIYSLDELVKHIYGKLNLLPRVDRPHMFIKELQLYVAYLKTDLENNFQDLNEKRLKYYAKFKTQLLTGIEYYRKTAGGLFTRNYKELEKFKAELDAAEGALRDILKESLAPYTGLVARV